MFMPNDFGNGGGAPQGMGGPFDLQAQLAALPPQIRAQVMARMGMPGQGGMQAGLPDQGMNQTGPMPPPQGGMRPGLPGQGSQSGPMGGGGNSAIDPRTGQPWDRNIGPTARSRVLSQQPAPGSGPIQGGRAPMGPGSMTPDQSQFMQDYNGGGGGQIFGGGPSGRAGELGLINTPITQLPVADMGDNRLNRGAFPGAYGGPHDYWGDGNGGAPAPGRFPPMPSKGQSPGMPSRGGQPGGENGQEPWLQGVMLPQDIGPGSANERARAALKAQWEAKNGPWQGPSAQPGKGPEMGMGQAPVPAPGGGNVLNPMPAPISRPIGNARGPQMNATDRAAAIAADKAMVGGAPPYVGKPKPMPQTDPPVAGTATDVKPLVGKPKPLPAPTPQQDPLQGGTKPKPKPKPTLGRNYGPK